MTIPSWAHGVDVEIYDRDSDELLGIAHFLVDRQFAAGLIGDVRTQLIAQGLLLAGMALVVGAGILAARPAAS